VLGDAYLDGVSVGLYTQEEAAYYDVVEEVNVKIDQGLMEVQSIRL